MSDVVYLTPEADAMLREYIIGLADQVIAEKKYEGAKFDLCNYLCALIYRCVPTDLRERQITNPRATN